MQERRPHPEMDKVGYVFNRFASLIDRDIKGVHIGCYSVALIGLTIAIRKVRPFSKFKRPGDIPNHFIQEKRELTGVVKRIDPNGGLLMVEHKPLVDIPLIKTGQLPVKISGVKVTGLGLNWLQAIVAGQQIKFVPVTKAPHFLQCEVLLIQKTKNEKEDFLNVGESLLKIGFGQTEPVMPPLSLDPKFLSYYKRLQAAEKVALRKKLGLKYYVKPTKNALTILYKSLNELSKNLTKTAYKKLKTIPQFSST
ncbi:protein C3orf33 homolog [Euwallacea similis]|uniref:protein C3orf33 homolog n=1 Tax=Euwallacea similis TaxID=1736056 RepID=UPI00344C4D4A